MIDNFCFSDTTNEGANNIAAGKHVKVSNI